MQRRTPQEDLSGRLRRRPRIRPAAHPVDLRSNPRVQRPDLQPLVDFRQFSSSIAGFLGALGDDADRDAQEDQIRSEFEQISAARQKAIEQNNKLVEAGELDEADSPLFRLSHRSRSAVEAGSLAAGRADELLQQAVTASRQINEDGRYSPFTPLEDIRDDVYQVLGNVQGIDTESATYQREIVQQKRAIDARLSETYAKAKRELIREDNRRMFTNQTIDSVLELSVEEDFIPALSIQDAVKDAFESGMKDPVGTTVDAFSLAIRKVGESDPDRAQHLLDSIQAASVNGMRLDRHKGISAQLNKLDTDLERMERESIIDEAQEEAARDRETKESISDLSVIPLSESFREGGRKALYAKQQELEATILESYPEDQQDEAMLFLRAHVKSTIGDLSDEVRQPILSDFYEMTKSNNLVGASLLRDDAAARGIPLGDLQAMDSEIEKLQALDPLLNSNDANQSRNRLFQGLGRHLRSKSDVNKDDLGEATTRLQQTYEKRKRELANSLTGNPEADALFADGLQVIENEILEEARQINADVVKPVEDLEKSIRTRIRGLDSGVIDFIEDSREELGDTLTDNLKDRAATQVNPEIFLGSQETARVILESEEIFQNSLVTDAVAGGTSTDTVNVTENQLGDPVAAGFTKEFYTEKLKLKRKFEDKIREWFKSEAPGLDPIKRKSEFREFLRETQEELLGIDTTPERPTEASETESTTASEAEEATPTTEEETTQAAEVKAKADKKISQMVNTPSETFVTHPRLKDNTFDSVIRTLGSIPRGLSGESAERDIIGLQADYRRHRKNGNATSAEKARQELQGRYINTIAHLKGFRHPAHKEDPEIKDIVLAMRSNTGIHLSEWAYGIMVPQGDALKPIGDDIEVERSGFSLFGSSTAKVPAKDFITDIPASAYENGANLNVQMFHNEKNLNEVLLGVRDDNPLETGMVKSLFERFGVNINGRVAEDPDVLKWFERQRKIINKRKPTK